MCETIENKWGNVKDVYGFVGGPKLLPNISHPTILSLDKVMSINMQHTQTNPLSTLKQDPTSWSILMEVTWSIFHSCKHGDILSIQRIHQY